MKQFYDFTNFAISNQTKPICNTKKYNAPLFVSVVLISKKDTLKVQEINF